MSSVEYTTDSSEIENYFVHLTNNAIQKFSEGYGQQEDGNQLSFKTFFETLAQRDDKDKKAIRERIYNKMKEIARQVFGSVKKKINQ